jgi:DNA helicase-2/ATP-dependent DNA helicase PcrA
VDLSSLNKVQREVVEYNEGPLMVLAGAGSGKTKTLVSKIAYLIEDKGYSPYQILALTFSNKAAREMRERIAKTVRVDLGSLQVTTFHSFCARLLRSEAEYLGLSKHFTIYDSSESKAVVKTILAKRGYGPKDLSPYEVLNTIEYFHNNGYYPGATLEDPHFHLDKNDPFYSMYLEYLEELRRANSVDFGGLITGVLELFEKYPNVLTRYQERYKYLLIDEYQDTNRAQFRLMKLLAEKTHKVCVVGDEDQSIYSWRGADIRNILDFEDVYENAVLLKLEQNYRSCKTIIEAASAVIARNSQRKGKTMWTDNPDGSVIDIVECHNETNEAEYVADQIKGLFEKGVPLDEVAVFYRTNSQSRLIEDALRKLNLSYRIVGGVKFYERKEVKDLLAYLKLVVNPKENLSFSRIINVPARGVGATTLRKLEEEAVKQTNSLMELCSDIVNNEDNYTHIKLSSRIRSGLREITSLMDDVTMMREKKALPSKIYEKILHDSGYYMFLKASKDYESIARLENLDELLNAIKQYEESVVGEATLDGFLETITLDSFSELDENGVAKTEEISLMTIHGSKGLEFHHVYVVGAEENLFPSFRSLEDGEIGIEEERRLFYVAMTRAMKALTITFAQARMLFGQIKFNGPSRFINEIPPKYYSWKKVGGEREKNSYYNDGPSYDDFDQSYDDDGPVYQVDRSVGPSVTDKKSFAKPKFPSGTKVIHGLYGEGKVISSEGSGADEKVMIQFSSGDKKKFAVKFAPLTAI